MLDKYLKQFATLRRAPGAVWTETTRKRAPHKPLLLMAIMDLIARGFITSSFIDVTADLVCLRGTFLSTYLNCLIDE